MTEKMFERMIRAARLDVELFREVEADANLTQEALIVVILVSVLSGVGTFLNVLIGPRGFAAAILGLIIGIVLPIIGYFVWAFVTYIIGVNVFQGTADYGEMLRTIGYAYSPHALSFFKFIPCIGPLITLAGAIWSLVAGVVAIREALDFDTTKAIITVIIGWIVMLIIYGIVGAVLGVAGLGLTTLTR
ncbi:MAG: hypothetical protein DRI61_02890 [Chloroflexi bacterium]|nr:MAG: hypothetical protein DRI61_02890 [Chloroflexota bacterium]HDN79501.1 YIP1 family protein [Chloroflexota bacterium]